MEFDFSTLLDRSMMASLLSKYLTKGILLIDYVPFLGPLYNASFALNLLFSFWPSKAQQMEESEPSDQLQSVAREKERLIRIKGLTVIVSALIDIFALCLTVGVLAYVCDCLVRIATFTFIRHLLILFILINYLTLTVGSKIITCQLVEKVTYRLEEVNYVGNSMVKSVTITATAIEKIVETTNSSTSALIEQITDWWTAFVASIVAIITFPLNAYRNLQSNVNRRLLMTQMKARKVKYNVRRVLGSARGYVTFRRAKTIKEE